MTNAQQLNMPIVTIFVLYAPIVQVLVSVLNAIRMDVQLVITSNPQILEPHLTTNAQHAAQISLIAIRVLLILRVVLIVHSAILLTTLTRVMVNAIPAV